MDIIIFLLGITIGFLSFTYIGLQIVLTNTVSAKLIKKDINKGFTADYCSMYRKMLTTVTLCSYLLYGTIILAEVLGYLLHSDVFMIIFFVGWGISLLFSIGKIGINLNNTTDYYRTYRKEYAATTFSPYGYKYTLFYKLRFVILFLLVLPQPIISTLLNDGKSLGAIPMVLLWEPVLFFVSNWHNAFSPYNKNISQSLNEQPVTTSAPVNAPQNNDVVQPTQYNKDTDMDSKSNPDYKQDTAVYVNTKNAASSYSDIQTPPFDHYAPVNTAQTVIVRPKKKLGKGTIAIIVLLSIVLAVVVIGSAVYVGIQIGESKNPNRHANDISVTESSSKPTDYIAKDYKKTVYVIKDGNNWSYHDKNCECISDIRGTTAYSMTKQEAVRNGFKRCTICNP